MQGTCETYLLCSSWRNKINDAGATIARPTTFTPLLFRHVSAHTPHNIRDTLPVCGTTLHNTAAAAVPIYKYATKLGHLKPQQTFRFFVPGTSNSHSKYVITTSIPTQR